MMVAISRCRCTRILTFCAARPASLRSGQRARLPQVPFFSARGTTCGVPPHGQIMA